MYHVDDNFSGSVLRVVSKDEALEDLEVQRQQFMMMKDKVVKIKE